MTTNLRRILATWCMVLASGTASLLAQNISISTSAIPSVTNPSGLTYNMLENGSPELLTVTITDATWNSITFDPGNYLYRSGAGPAVLEWDIYDDASYTTISDVIEVFNNANNQAVIQFGSDDEQGNLPTMQYAPNLANVVDNYETDGTFDELGYTGIPLIINHGGVQMGIDFIAFSDTDPTPVGGLSDSLQLGQFTTASVPEPGSCLIGGLGGLLLALKLKKSL